MVLTYGLFQRQIDSLTADKERTVKIPTIKTLGTLINRSDAGLSTPKRKTTTTKQAVGDFAEDLAHHFLQKNGLTIVQRNFLCKAGEIDLIVLDRKKNEPTLVFVEVRYRSKQTFGGGLESITASKQAKLRRSAHMFLLQEGTPQIACRFDVISVSGVAKNPKINWIENAF